MGGTSHQPLVSFLVSKANGRLVMLFPGSAGLATQSFAVHPRPSLLTATLIRWPGGSVRSSLRRRSLPRSYQKFRLRKMSSIQTCYCGARATTSWAVIFVEAPRCSKH